MNSNSKYCSLGYNVKCEHTYVEWYKNVCNLAKNLHRQILYFRLYFFIFSTHIKNEYWLYKKVFKQSSTYVNLVKRSWFIVRIYTLYVCLYMCIKSLHCYAMYRCFYVLRERRKRGGWLDCYSLQQGLMNPLLKIV